ncbi:MAG: hypothetical protein IJR99_04090 [Kiritimatiellae bacterium]|nr:hypothetical protein [Kiritimatiellia bacterium]
MKCLRSSTFARGALCLTGCAVIIQFLFDISRLGFLWSSGYLSSRTPFICHSAGIMAPAVEMTFYERNELLYQISVTDLDFYLVTIAGLVTLSLYSRRFSVSPRLTECRRRTILEKSEKELKWKGWFAVLSILLSANAFLDVSNFLMNCSTLQSETGSLLPKEVSAFLQIVPPRTADIVSEDTIIFCKVMKKTLTSTLCGGAILCALWISFERLQRFVEREKELLDDHDRTVDDF